MSLPHQRGPPRGHGRPSILLSSRRLGCVIALIVVATFILLFTSPITADFTQSFFGSIPQYSYLPRPGHLKQWIAEEDARYSRFVDRRWELIRQQGQSIESYVACFKPRYQPAHT
jgi:predicted PurR-regulated permease PerM